MSHNITTRELYDWCAIPAAQLEKHAARKVPFRLVPDSHAMGETMARTFVDEIQRHNATGTPTRAIVPCGPTAWYKPFTQMVNTERVSLKQLFVFHMDECLDWQGRLLPRQHPYNFRGYMEQHFYGGIAAELAVPVAQRYWLTPQRLPAILAALAAAPVDITLGGWGQDGHIAYNQARRQPYSRLTLDELRQSSARIQENNPDTILALAQRSFGTAYQFVPPMSVTLGVKECLAARKVRVFSDTGAWKQTALRVALFAPPTVEYPLTLLQEHPDALITATLETARHPISENPTWDFFGNTGYFEE